MAFTLVFSHLHPELIFTAASEPGGFFPSTQRLVLWLVTRAQPSLGTYLRQSSSSSSVAGAEGRWTSSIVALLKVHWFGFTFPNLFWCLIAAPLMLDTALSLSLAPSLFL